MDIKLGSVAHKIFDSDLIVIHKIKTMLILKKPALLVISIITN